MLAECKECGQFIARYWENSYKEPCPQCGSTLFYIVHLGIDKIPTHKILKNMSTGEVFGHDLCDLTLKDVAQSG